MRTKALGIALAVFAAGCGSDSGITESACGAGTTLVGSQCVATATLDAGMDGAVGDDTGDDAGSVSDAGSLDASAPSVDAGMSFCGEGTAQSGGECVPEFLVGAVTLDNASARLSHYICEALFRCGCNTPATSVDFSSYSQLNELIFAGSGDIAACKVDWTQTFDRVLFAPARYFAHESPPLTFEATELSNFVESFNLGESCDIMTRLTIDGDGPSVFLMGGQSMGEPCFQNWSCATGLVCNSVSQTCEPPSMSGACGDEETDCAPGFYCSGSTCAAESTCSTNADCGVGKSCISGACASLGSGCDVGGGADHDDCLPNQYCDGGTCMSDKGDGIACTDDSECASEVCESSFCTADICAQFDS